MRTTARFAVLFAASQALPAVSTTSLAAGIASERVASGLSRPIYATAPEGDDRLFIVEQRGVIKILRGGSVLPAPFLDIDALIPDIGGNDERGLLGMAFHPDYPANGWFFLNYTDISDDTVIVRYSVSGDPDIADPGSAVIVLTIAQPYSNHDGGTIRFGPLDGYLYAGMGDGGSSGDPQDRAQDDATLLGKMLRIDVDGAPPYAIPPTNPFAGPGLPLDEIWAKGLRNPYRWSFDRLTGDLWIADVGQSSWEEIDFEPAGSSGGLNYGWRRMEGAHCYNPPSACNDGSLILPIYEYSHGGTPWRCSITGGSVYRGSEIPSLSGSYLFADFCSNQVWSLRYDGAAVTELLERTAELAPGGGLSIGAIAAFGEDGNGEIYIVDRGNGTDGEIYKLRPSPANAEQGPNELRPLVSPARPNPFSESTAFELEIPRPGEVELIVIDVAGRNVRRLAQERWDAGRRTIKWDGQDESGDPLPAGVYFVYCSIEGERTSRRILRIP